MHQRHRAPIPAAELRRLAVLVDADPRTVRAVLEGAPLQNLTRVRVARFLRERGYLVSDECTPVGRERQERQQ
jgi:hypothetical protein